MSETITVEKFGTTGCLVSDTGRVFIELPQNSSGYRGNYQSVSIKGARFYVHRLVAACFIPNPEGKPEINHKNNDHADNSVSNLEWVTRAENANHHMGKNGVNKSIYQEARKKRCKSVISSDGNIYQSIVEAAKATGTLGPNITLVCQGANRHANGIAWAYYNDGDAPPPKPLNIPNGYSESAYSVALQKKKILMDLLAKGETKKEIWRQLGIKNTKEYLRLENLPTWVDK